MNRGRYMLLAQRPGRRLGPTPGDLTTAQQHAWRDVVAAVPGDLLRATDASMLRVLAVTLANWRSERDYPVRLLYRLLGNFFIPMRDRRRLLFPERVAG